MNKILNALTIFAVLSSVLCGCSPAQTSKDAGENGSIDINASTYSLDVAQGEVVEFFSTVTQAEPNNSTMIVRVAPGSGNRWRFSLCYGIQCFISNGDKTIEKRIDLSPNSPMEFGVQIFAPEQASPGDSSTVTLEVQSAASNASKAVSFTATVR
jgi:hypothetical protein